MKRPKKITVAADRVTVCAATVSLFLLGAGLTGFGIWLGSGVLSQVGLITLLPALTQLALLLPVIAAPTAPEQEPDAPKRKVKWALFCYRLRNWYYRSRSAMAGILIGILTLAIHVVFWRFLPAGSGNLSWLVPVVLAVAFVVGVALDKWCSHAAANADAYRAAQLKGLSSACFLLRVSLILALIASLLKLIGLYDADGIVRVLLQVVMIYGTAVLAFCVGVRLIRKEMDTRPELLVNLIGMGADMNILTYLEENTGITMRSLWSLRLIKQLLPGAILGVALLCWLSTCFCQIEAHQEGALFRLGKLQDHTLQPGLHMTLPWPFDQVDIYNTRSVNRVSIGYIATGDQDNIWTETHGGEEYLLLLGGGNEMVSINLQVEYCIEDLLSYIRTSASPESLLQAQAYEIVTARTIATDLDTLLAADRESFSETFRQELTQRIAPYGAGLKIVNVVLESIHPPVDIADVYQDIISAGIDAEYIRINAQAAAATRITKAEQEKSQTVSTARSEQHELIGNAQAAVTEFMASAAADKEYRDEYRFYKYINAITQTYSGSTMILCGEGIDTSRLVLSGFKEEPEPEETVPDYPEEEYEEEYFEYQEDEAGY